jgi:hypothetical protein
MLNATGMSLLLFIFGFLLFICAFNAWVISPPSPHVSAFKRLFQWMVLRDSIYPSIHHQSVYHLAIYHLYIDLSSINPVMYHLST